MLSVETLKALLHLKPLPVEGGYYAESYRSAESIAGDSLPGRYAGARSFGTGIYYLLTPDTCSMLHRLKSDEVYHFYLGDPVELLQLGPGELGTVVTLGPDLERGMKVQHVVPRGLWQGSRLRPRGRWALLGTTMAPGFDFADFEAGGREPLLRAYPQFEELILALTKTP
nr:cupin domain-containing protein [Nitrospirota bacterium]